jgi:cation diffusion facilitator family transporter
MNDQISSRSAHPVDWIHDHVFDAGNVHGQRSTRMVAWITLCTMTIEIAGGWWWNSMALLADGWHMSSHAVAIGLSAVAYASARRYAKDARFAFGTWKIEILAGFASAMVLIGVALLMLMGSVDRMLSPQPIHYPEAMAVAALGLVVNVVCALILGHAHHASHGNGHGHSHGHEDEHGHTHTHDLNLRSAHVHVLADAATSVLAIAALLGGWMLNWSWLDPVMGIVGAVLVGVWAKGLIVDTGKILLDREMDHPLVHEIQEVIQSLETNHQTHITDLHVWRVGQQAYSCAIALVTTDRTLTPELLRRQLAVHEEIVHTIIELNHI